MNMDEALAPVKTLIKEKRKFCVNSAAIIVA